jgi:hypothetical protein
MSLFSFNQLIFVFSFSVFPSVFSVENMPFFLFSVMYILCFSSSSFFLQTFHYISATFSPLLLHLFLWFSLSLSVSVSHPVTTLRCQSNISVVAATLPDFPLRDFFCYLIITIKTKTVSRNCAKEISGLQSLLISFFLSVGTEKPQFAMH